MRSASRPSKRAPVSARVRVRATPMRAATNGAICAGGMPSPVSDSANFASAAASTTSPAHSSPSPPPNAAPSTTMTIACGSASNRVMNVPNSRFPSATGSFSPAFGGGDLNIVMKPRISPPAQNVPFAPRTTMALVSRSVSSTAVRAASSRTISRLSALRASGRLSVMCSRRSWRSSSSVSKRGNSLMALMVLPLPRQRAHGLADDAEHDLVCAAADRGQPRVAIHARDLALGHVTHAAPILQAGVADLAHQPPGGELRHRGKLRHVRAGEILLDRTVNVRTQHLHFGLELRKPEVHHLIVQNALAEGLPPGGVFDGHADHALHLHQPGGRSPDALLLELLHLIDEAHAFFADAIALRYAHIVEEDLRRVGGTHAELVELARDLDTLGL